MDMEQEAKVVGSETQCMLAATLGMLAATRGTAVTIHGCILVLVLVLALALALQEEQLLAVT